MANRTVSKTTRISQDYEAFANESLSVGASSVQLTQSIFDPLDGKGLAQNAFVTIETNSIRYWIDGTTPTPSLGHIARAGESFELFNYRNLQNFKTINEDDGFTSTIRVTYGR